MIKWSADLCEREKEWSCQNKALFNIKNEDFFHIIDQIRFMGTIVFLKLGFMVTRNNIQPGKIGGNLWCMVWFLYKKACSKLFDDNVKKLVLLKLSYVYIPLINSSPVL